MDVDALKKLLDDAVNQWAAGVAPTTPGEVTEVKNTTDVLAEVVPERKLPEGKRVVRTKNSGDRVYLLDEVKKTRQWVTNPEVLKGLGFEQTDVTEVGEAEMMGYNMGPALYKAPDEQA